MTTESCAMVAPVEIFLHGGVGVVRKISAAANREFLMVRNPTYPISRRWTSKTTFNMV